MPTGKIEVVEFKSTHDRKVRGTDVKKGQTLYAVKQDGLYFAWCYSNRDTALRIADKFEGRYWDAQERAANWKSELSQSTASDLAPEKV